MKYTVYFTESGEISKVCECPENMITFQLSDGESYTTGGSSDTVDYVVNGAVTPRPEMPVTVTGTTLNVPLGTEFSVRGPATAEGVSDDGVIEFEFAEPGTYTVLLRNFPYLDTEVTLEG